MKMLTVGISSIAVILCISPARAADKAQPAETWKTAVTSKTTESATSNPVVLSDENSKVTLVYDHPLPNVPGKSMRSLLVEYKPSGRTPAHTHPKSAFVYATILEGEIRSQVNDGPIKTYKTGESFSEMPGDVHKVSENASQTKPAKLLAVFVVDSDEKELTTICK